MMRFGNSVCALFAWAVLLVPACSYASAWISEIHYNPEGSDSGYEWVEWHNTGNDDIDIVDYAFREQGTNHRLSISQGEAEIAAGEYVVVADNAEKFLSVYPDYEGTLIDSSFSLHNSGELLEIVDETDSTIFSVTYDPATGGDGNGHSIGLVEDVWHEVYASPGAANTVVAPSEGTEEEDEETATSTEEDKDTESTDQEYTTPATDNSPATYIEIKNPEYTEKTVRADAGGDRTVMAGAAYWFGGRVFGLAGGPIEHPRIRWNWGDGSTGEGPRDRHTYRYPGEYTLVMSATVHKYTSRDRVTVTVIPPALTLSVETIEEEDVARVENTSRYALELSGYGVESSQDTFVFPEETFVNAGQTLHLESGTSGLGQDIEGEIRLVDAYGEVIDSHHPERAILAQQVVQAQSHETSASTTILNADTSPPADIPPAAQPVPPASPPGGTHSVAYAYAPPQEAHTPGARAVAFDERSNTPALPTPTVPEHSQEAQIYTASPALSPLVWLLIVLVATTALLYARYAIIERRHTRHTHGYTITDHNGKKVV